MPQLSVGVVEVGGVGGHIDLALSIRLNSKSIIARVRKFNKPIDQHVKFCTSEIHILVQFFLTSAELQPCFFFFFLQKK